MGGFEERQRLAQARMGQDKVVIHLEQDQLTTQAVAALARRGAAPSNRHHPLPQAQIEPLDQRGIDLPTAGIQDLLDRRLRPQHHTVTHLDEAPPSHG